MQARASNRALLSLVAELAGFGDDDLQAILAELDPASRSRLSALLDAYHRGDAFDAPSSAAISAIVLSPWLTDRLSLNHETRPTGMTPHASRTLGRVVVDHGWTDNSISPARPRALRPLLTRLGL